MSWENHFELWKESEAIAIHFNELIITLRTQALGGLAATTAILLGVIGHSVKAGQDTEGMSPKTGWGILGAAFVLLAAFWSALAVLDLGYYSRLLEGAVVGIIEIEEETNGIVDAMNKVPPLIRRDDEFLRINLSHHIRAAMDPEFRESLRTQDGAKESIVAKGYESLPVIDAFYTIVFGILIVSSIYSFIRYSDIGWKSKVASWTGTIALITTFWFVCSYLLSR